jgi:hypothetical protein
MNETSNLGNLQRHEARWPCPVCGGHAGLPQHRGVRCAGFTLDRVVYCTREEHAGNLPFDMTVSPGAYQHRRFGACGCGTAHGWGSVVATHEPPHQRQEIASIEQRDEVYSFALNILDLRPDATRDLQRRGLSDAALAAWRFRSVPRLGHEHQEFMARIRDRFEDGLLRRCPGFADKNGRLTFWSAQGDRDGYIVPYVNEEARSPAGNRSGLVAVTCRPPAPSSRASTA